MSVRSKDGRPLGCVDRGVASATPRPDPGSAEAARAKVATEPVGVTGSEQVQVRVTRPRTRRRPARPASRRPSSTAAPAPRTRRLGSTPAATAGAAAVKPTIISRAQWGADESLRTCSPDYVDKVKGAIVHHTVNSNTYSADSVPALLRGIYAYHVNGNGWCDIGYQFFVDRFGRLFEGRYGGEARNVVGAQAQGFNVQTFAVSSLGNHDPGTAGRGRALVRRAHRDRQADRLEGLAQRLGPRRPRSATPPRAARAGPRAPSSPSPGSPGTATST